MKWRLLLTPDRLRKLEATRKFTVKLGENELLVELPKEIIMQLMTIGREDLPPINTPKSQMN